MILFLKSLHYYWLDSLCSLVALDKYVRKALNDRNTGVYAVSHGFLDRFTLDE